MLLASDRRAAKEACKAAHRQLKHGEGRRGMHVDLRQADSH